MRLMTHAPPATGRFRATIAMMGLSQKIASTKAGLEHLNVVPAAAPAKNFGAALSKSTTFGRPATVGALV